MSSGPVNPFVDFGSNANDSNENNATSIQPVVDGEAVNQTVLTRPTENMRKRSEVIRARVTDSVFLENADRVLLISGPGKVTWPGSTTAAASGIPVISDVLWILPMLTPGFAQSQPVPPIASAFGVLHLQRATGPSNAILVTSQRRSYAAGDQINITVTAGSVYTCTLDTEDSGALRRTIKIVATGSTTLGTVIASLNGLTPPAPDNTQLVTAALEGGALSGDLILTTQTRQFVSGNYDGEGHTLTPANVASFFSGNPTQVLAEGDTLCVAYASLFDTASNGGRRQSIPENSNTAIPAGSFFNSRVHPELLFNALPICKVVNGRLVFSTGTEVPAGVTLFDLSAPAASNVAYSGGGTWADSTTNPATTVENQLDKIISDLAGASGSAKIQGVVNSDLAAGTVKQQLDAISSGWLKTSRPWGLSSSAFIVQTGTVFLDNPGFGWNFNTTGLVQANLGLPAGTVLTKLRVGYDRSGANSFQVQMGSIDLSTGSGGSHAVLSDLSSTGYTVVDITTFGVDGSGNFDGSPGSYTILGNRIYWIYIAVNRTTGTPLFVGAIINP